jgi:hypothetical protein
MQTLRTLALAGALWSGTAYAALVNIQFGLAANTFLPTPAYTGAGVFGAAGDWWNPVMGPRVGASPEANLPLSDAAHAATGIELTYTGITGFYNTAQSALPPLMGGTEYANLLDSYAYTTGTATLTLSGLMAGASYDLVLYAISNSVGRESLFTVGGVTQSVVPAATAGLVAGRTYTDFRNLIADADGRLIILVRGNNEADINGLQLTESVAMPEPGTVTLVAAAMTLLAWSRVRRPHRA